MNPWNERSIIGQAPMDGVTDAAFRYITDIHGKPDLLCTEFVSVEGLGRGAVRLLTSFVKHTTETPILGQVYGSEPEQFYSVAIILAELGYSGVDINMGCPDKAIAKRGAGAGLIKTPRNAQDVIKSVQSALKDWNNGATLDSIDIPSSIIDWVKMHRPKHINRTLLPVSVKTRIGYDSINTVDWISNLLEASPDGISIHGRTLEQMYTGSANWDEIGKAKEIAQDSNTKIVGNGDVKSRQDALDKIERFNLDGVLIGRASFGNPWIFADHQEVSDKKRLETALEHCQAFQRLTPDGHFVSLRKHLAWYCKYFRNSATVRDQLMRVQTIKDVADILHTVIPRLE